MMPSVPGLLLLGALATGALVEECNPGDFIVEYKLQVLDETGGQGGWVVVTAPDGRQSFTLHGDRTITSYAPGTAVVVTAPYDIAPVEQLVKDREDLRGLLAKGTLTPAVAMAVRDRIAGIGKTLERLTQPPASGQIQSRRLAICSVELKAGATVAVSIGTTNGGTELTCAEGGL